MPVTTFHEYVRQSTDVLNRVIATGQAVLHTFQIDQPSAEVLNQILR